MTNKKNKKSRQERAETQMVKFSQIVGEGPVRQELTETQIGRLKVIYDTCGYLSCSTLEEFELGFMRDYNPDSEIDIWERITVAYYKAMQHYPECSLPEKQRIANPFIGLSAGQDLIFVSDARKKWVRMCWENVMNAKLDFS